MDIDDIGIYLEYIGSCVGSCWAKGSQRIPAFHCLSRWESVLYLENPWTSCFKFTYCWNMLKLCHCSCCYCSCCWCSCWCSCCCGCNNSPYSSFYCYQTFALCCQCWHTVMDEMTWFNHLIAHPTKRKCFRRNAAFWQCIFVQHLPALSIRWRSCYKL